MTSGFRAFEVERVVVLVDGAPHTTDVYVIPEAAPDWIRRSVRTHRQATLDGRCGCGAVRPTSRAGARAPLAHTSPCPAHRLTMAMAAGAWSKLQQEGATRAAQAR